MSSKPVRDSFKRRLQEIIGVNGWTTQFIDMDNMRDEPAADLDWACIEFLGADETQITTGAPGVNVFREEGDLLIHYIVPSRTGSEKTVERLDIIRETFRATIVDSITIDSVGPPDTQPGSSLSGAKGNWWGGSILINYNVDNRG